MQTLGLTQVRNREEERVGNISLFTLYFHVSGRFSVIQAEPRERALLGPMLFSALKEIFLLGSVGERLQCVASL